MPLRIVLTEPSHPGNIGAVARAMKNMGFSELYLVNPSQFPHVEATVRASGADDVLANAVVVDALSEALVGCAFVMATSARERRLEWPLYTAREGAAQIASRSSSNCAIVFGRESSGLTNAELALSHAQIHIPTNTAFSSLNLAAAVQVIVYELRMALISDEAVPALTVSEDQVAPNEALEGLVQHLQSTMTSVKFLNPSQPRKLMHRLRRFFLRASPTTTEINILRGFLSAVDKACKNVIMADSKLNKD